MKYTIHDILKYKNLDDVLSSLNLGFSFREKPSEFIYKTDSKNVFETELLPVELSYLRTKYHITEDKTIYKPSWLIYTDDQGKVLKILTKMSSVTRDTLLNDMVDNSTVSLNELLKLINKKSNNFKDILDFLIDHSLSTVHFLDKESVSQDIMECFVSDTYIKKLNYTKNYSEYKFSLTRGDY